MDDDGVFLEVNGALPRRIWLLTAGCLLLLFGFLAGLILAGAPWQVWIFFVIWVTGGYPFLRAMGESCMALWHGACYFRGNGPFPALVCKFTLFGTRSLSTHEFVAEWGEFPEFRHPLMLRGLNQFPADGRKTLEKLACVQAARLSEAF